MMFILSVYTTGYTKLLNSADCNEFRFKEKKYA